MKAAKMENFVEAAPEDSYNYVSASKRGTFMENMHSREMRSI